MNRKWIGGIDTRIRFLSKNINLGIYGRISIFYKKNKKEKGLIMCKLFEGYWWY